MVADCIKRWRRRQKLLDKKQINLINYSKRINQNPLIKRINKFEKSKNQELSESEIKKTYLFFKEIAEPICEQSLLKTYLSESSKRKIYITGDRHGNFSDIGEFCVKTKTKKDDIMIVLGDAGINYYGNKKDIKLKESLSNLPITLFCIHGNHENRPNNIDSYEEKNFLGGTAYIEPNYPNIIFAKDGEAYDINGYKCLVIGGAYSVDKEYRLLRGYSWWEDEQPTPSIKNAVETKIEALRHTVDVVLTHTCPSKYIPIEMFLPFIDQSKVDNSTEEWLNEIEKNLNYTKWFCGHYHTNKTIDKIEFLFDNIKKFEI